MLNIAIASPSDKCTSVTVIQGESCGSSSQSMQVVVENTCDSNLNAKVCFETLNKGWKCSSSTVYGHDTDYGFLECESTGKYKIDSCLKGDSTCVKKYVSLKCNSGDEIEFTIDVLAKGVNRIKTKPGTSATILSRKDTESGEYYLSMVDISKMLCGEPNHSSSIVGSLLSTLSVYFAQRGKLKLEECKKTASESACNIKYFGTLQERRTTGGVR
jgi:hypothetical protein